MPRLVVIVGPTGAGKTRLSLELAERVGGEVISCDSQQVYIGMDIGTGKVPAVDRARVRHHLLDVVKPDAEMTAARFVELADAAIAASAISMKRAIVISWSGRTTSSRWCVTLACSSAVTLPVPMSMPM